MLKSSAERWASGYRISRVPCRDRQGRLSQDSAAWKVPSLGPSTTEAIHHTKPSPSLVPRGSCSSFLSGHILPIQLQHPEQAQLGQGTELGKGQYLTQTKNVVCRPTFSYLGCLLKPQVMGILPSPTPIYKKEIWEGPPEPAWLTSTPGDSLDALNFENTAPDKHPNPDPGPGGSGCLAFADYKPPPGSPRAALPRPPPLTWVTE